MTYPRDNVSVKVNAVLYFRIVDPERAIIKVEDFMAATSQLAQTTLRSVLGKHELDEMLAERDRLNAAIQEILDQQTDAWGIKVANIEIKDIDLAENMVRAIAKQAEAERLRRAKVINAEGEQQAAEKSSRPPSWRRSRRRCSCAISQPCTTSPVNAPRPSYSRCRWTSSAILANARLRGVNRAAGVTRVRARRAPPPDRQVGAAAEAVEEPSAHLVA